MFKAYGWRSAGTTATHRGLAHDVPLPEQVHLAEAATHVAVHQVQDGLQVALVGSHLRTCGGKQGCGSMSNTSGGTWAGIGAGSTRSSRVPHVPDRRGCGSMRGTRDTSGTWLWNMAVREHRSSTVLMYPRRYGAMASHFGNKSSQLYDHHVKQPHGCTRSQCSGLGIALHATHRPWHCAWPFKHKQRRAAGVQTG